MQNASEFSLFRQIYHYGHVGREPFGFMCFDSSGRITGYSNKKESRFSFDGKNLILLADDGRKTVEFEREKDGPNFRRVSGAKHYLKHIFGLGAPKPSDLPKVVVNTVPKAGTYLLAEALSISGYSQVRLHLADHFFHDNRNTPDNQIHWDPDGRRVDIPADVVSRILSHGEFLVGHIGSRNALNSIIDQEVQVINAVRDPRSQLVSLYHFALAKQKPTARSHLWRSIPEQHRFKAFLLSQDVKSIVDHNRILTSLGPFFCFEDLSKGKIIERNGKIFKSKKRRQVISDLSSAMSKAIGKPTSTQSNRNRKRDLAYFDDPAIAEFAAGPCGLKEFSDKYEMFLK